MRASYYLCTFGLIFVLATGEAFAQRGKRM